MLESVHPYKVVSGHYLSSIMGLIQLFCIAKKKKYKLISKQLCLFKVLTNMQVFFS